MKFRRLNAQRWTHFWEGLTSRINQNDRRIGKYRWSSIRRSFTNVGVDKQIVNKAQATFAVFREVERQMLRFNQFFVGNRDVLQVYLGTADINETFLKILELFENGDHEDVRRQMEGIHILRQLDRRGEGNEYVSASSATVGLNAFDVKRLQRRLSRALNKQYRALDPIEYREWTVYPLTKTTDWKSYIFLQLQKRRDKTIAAKIGASDLEQIIIRSHLAKVFGIYLRSVEVNANFTKFMEFIQHGGESEHFVLKSTGFVSGDFVVSVRRKFSGRRSSALDSSSILGKLKNPDQLDQLLLKHTNGKLVQRPIAIYASTFRNARVIGAIILNFRDRNFRAHQRDGIRRDFQEDFGIPMGAFIRYQEPSEKELCQLFLENEVRRKTARIGVRLDSTKKAWDLYAKLAELGILEPELEEEIITSHCFNRSCEMRYKSQDARQGFCDDCGYPLCDKNDITISSINEERIAQWLRKKAKQHGFSAIRIVKRKILSKTVFVLGIEKGNKKMNFMPITSSPNEHFLEVLSARYPDVCIITSKDNIDAFAAVRIHAVRLFEFFYDLEVQNKQVLTRNSKTIRRNVTGRMAQRAEDAAEHLQSDDYYLRKNRVAKNLGAELFEADCHALLLAMFGSSIWLGAKSRGQAVPDGRSVFPYFPSIGIDKGCFVWDTKFTSDRRSKIGGPLKNQKYVSQLYTEPVICGNSGKGLLFVSNKMEQTSFRSTALGIVKKKRVKVSYMQSKHLLAIYQHFLENRQQIDDDERAKKSFFTMLKDLLTSTSRQNGGKILVLSNDMLNKILEENELELQALQ